jgi:hypothetical protein
MAAETLSCPYCNSSVTLLRPAGAGQRLRCPRCHEFFPYRGGQGIQPRDHTPLADAAETTDVFEKRSRNRSSRPWSNRAVALAIVSVMLVMAAIGFTFAWFTTETRRQRDRSGEISEAASSRVVSVAPAKLRALGFLPDGTDAIAAIHVAELMSRPETAAILQLMRADRTNFGIERLEQVTGLRLEDLDHVVVGLKMQEADLPHLYLVVQTRFPYDQRAIREKLDAKRRITAGDKFVYRIALEQMQPGGVLWCADDWTLVFGLQQKDLADLPTKPISGVNRFSPQIQKYFAPGTYPETKLIPLPGQGPILDKGTQLWVVGASTRWDDILGFLQLFGLADADRRALGQVRAFCGQVRCFGNVAIKSQDGNANALVDARMEAQCADARTASEFEKYLGSKGVDAKHFETMARQQPQAASLLRECAQFFHRERNGDQVFVSLKVTIPSIRQALGHGALGGRTVE